MGNSIVEDDLRKQLVAMLPVESNVTNITYEGPFLVVYSKNPKVKTYIPVKVFNQITRS